MSKIKGKVEAAGKGKFSYFVKLDNSPLYFNTKFEPKCKKGDTVGIEYAQKDEKRANINKLVVLEEGANPVPTKGGSGSYGDSRQDSIVWQHSQEMALTAAGLLLVNGAYAVKGTPDEKRIQIVGLIDELSSKFFDEALDPRNSKAYKTTKEVEKDAEPEAEAEEDSGDWDDTPDSADSWD